MAPLATHRGKTLMQLVGRLLAVVILVGLIWFIAKLPAFSRNKFKDGRTPWD